MKDPGLAVELRAISQLSVRRSSSVLAVGKPILRASSKLSRISEFDEEV